METLYYFNYNNYVNRIVKGYATLNEYIQNGTLLGSTNKASFNKLSEKEAETTFISESSPDYCVAVDKYGNIESRWFVIDEQRKNYTNLKLNLKRDLVFDNLSIILNNENTLIKRGYCNYHNDAILNHEKEFSFNEYKRREIPIKDWNNKGWMAIFITPKQKVKCDTLYEEMYYPENNVSGEVTITSNTTDEKVFDENNSKGYGMILIPIIVFEHPEYPIVTFKSGINQMTIKYDGTSYDIPYVLNGYDVISFINNNIINSDAFVDIQMIPDSVNGASYSLVNGDLLGLTGETVLGISVDSSVYTADSKTNFLCMTKITPLGKHPYALFPISFNPTVKTTTSIPVHTSADYSLQIAETDPKLIEAYKCYITSPDRSSNMEIDLRKFISSNPNDLTGLPSSIPFGLSYMYQPYQSYMYVYPYYQNDNYFGSNAEDGRGLLCGYNNQILRTTDAWLSFLLSNKNYLNSFNLEMRDSYINTATGALTGAISGATTGALVSGGNPIGAVVGGVVGGFASLVQGLVNTDEKRQQFEWSCDNIKSKPQSVAKVASFTPMNSVYPTISVYYNDAVVNGLFNKYLKLNGYTINKIGKIDDYIGYNTNYKYVVAHIIKLEAFNGTADELLEIQNELERGLYFEIDNL